ncbi:hypothetical protein LK994_10375 [Ferruginibacter lapsinanis]|uniref:hypothetical protein n=1 Tax=Ferruginibacter lapsinanis TaxID=563172 RepID=UPI001E3E7264|nr:hypothetical protein [Ferruginibacter lapsinanis]UEG49036.1 hypothetical protein LK994_10375 [Ferruginibacter lapsinanis]
MKKYISSFLLILFAGAAQAQLAERPESPQAAFPVLRINAGTYVVGSDNLHLVLYNNSFTNNGNYTDSTGTFVIKGLVNQAGTGSTLVKDMLINTSSTLNLSTSIKTIGTISNNGTFNPGASSVEYGADGDQNIAAGTYTTLITSGSGNKTLTGNTNITSTLGLNGNVKLITGNNLITLKGTTSTITGAAYGVASSSWIVTGDGGTSPSSTGLGGLVIENIGTTGRTTAITFPVGPTPSLYNPVQFTNTGTTDNFTVTVNNQPVPGATVSSSVNSTWLISEATPGGTDAIIGTQWVASQENSLFTRNNSLVAHSDGTSINYSNSVTNAAAGSGPYTLSGAGFTSFSPFGVINGAVVLPVKLTNFTLQQRSDNVILSWQTAQEFGSGNYIVQRSTNGINYVNIGSISAIAYSNDIHNYSFTDIAPANGNNYYRLQINDLNGRSTYSDIQTARVTPNVSFTIKENPATNGKVQVLVKSSDLFILQSLDGKILFKGRLNTGLNTININTISGGLYLLKSGNQTKKILVQ